MTNYAQLSLCCNHPENGQFAGHADFAEIQWPDKTIMRFDFEQTTVKQESSRLVVGKVACEYSSRWEWVGNWCWNLWTIKHTDAYRILLYLFKHRRATFEERDLEGDAIHAFDCLQYDAKVINHSQ